MKVISIFLVLCPLFLKGQMISSFARYMYLGDSLMMVKEFDDAKSHYREARRMAMNISDNNKMTEAEEKFNLADTADKKRLEETIERVDSLWRQAEKNGTIANANRLAILSRNSLDAGQIEKALKLALQAKLQLNQLDTLKLQPDSLDKLKQQPQIELTFGEAVQRNLTKQLYRADHEIISLMALPNDSSAVLVNIQDSVVVKIRVDDLFEPTLIFSHENHLSALVVSPSGKNLLLAFEDMQIASVDLYPDGAYKMISAHLKPVICFAFSPKGEYILSCSRDDKAILWDSNLNLSATLVGHKGNIYEGIFSPTEEKILTRSTDGTVKIWDFKGKLMATLDKHSNYIHSACFSSDGSKILTASADHTAKLWDIKGNVLVSFPHSEIVKKAIFIDQGTKILTQAMDKTISVWDLNGDRLFVLPHPDEVSIFKVLAENQAIIAGTESGEVFVWNIAGNLVRRMSAHHGRLLDIDFSSNNQLLLTTGADGISKLWDKNGNLLMTIELAATGNIVPSIFTKDGKHILSIIKNRLCTCPIPELAYKNMQ